MMDDQIYQLALRFLADEGITSLDEVDLLAEHIQEVIEDWCNALQKRE